MSSRSLTWRRIGVGAVAVATVAAGSPLLLSNAANAATATRLVISQENGRASAAAYTCTPFTVEATDPFGNAADAATVTVTIAESPETATHDVDFCLVDGGTPFVLPPQYTNEVTTVPPALGGEEQEYDAGPSITTVSSDSPAPPPGYAAATPDNPDQADDATNEDFQGEADNNFNPDGTDTATFRTTGGLVRFGVAGMQVGAAATVDAFFDTDTNRSRNNDGDATLEDNVVAPQKRVTFSTGGPPGSVAVNNAVSRVELKPDESIAAKPGAASPATHTFTLQAFNTSGDVLGGVTQGRIIATSGPNTPSAGTPPTACSETGNEGEPATCTYSAQEPGTDTVTGFVNQSTGSPTPGLDTGEPRDTATAVTTQPAVAASQARTLVLAPESASVAAGTSRVFTATVTDVNGAPAVGASVTFLENGPGGLQGGTAGAGASSSRVVTTDSVGRASVTFLTSATDIGSNTVTATLPTTGTQCSTAGGTCADQSSVTITAPVSPAPSGSASPSVTPSASASATPTATPTGTASPSATTSPGQVEPGARYRGLSSPVRVLDTRDNRGARRTGEIVLDLSQQITDPNATSAVLNVTVTNGTRRGFLVAYPTGTTKPGTSNVNFETNQTQANEVVVRLGSNRRVSLFVDSASAHVIADLVGSFTTSTGAGVGEVTTNAPVRAFDSRSTGTPLRRNEVVVDLTGRIPSGSTDAILNVTVTRTTARGFVTVFPTGTTRPGTSNVNFEANQTQANEVITRVGTGSNANKVSLFVDSASAALIVDVVGAVSTTSDGQTFTALSSPQRALDTRSNSGTRRTGNISLTLPSSVPAEATGVILNVTATNGSRPGFVTVFPGGSTNPGTSNVNFPTSLTQANEVTTGLGPNNTVTLFVGGANSPAAHVIVDVVGYLTD